MTFTPDPVGTFASSRLMVFVSSASLITAPWRPSCSSWRAAATRRAATDGSSTASSKCEFLIFAWAPHFKANLHPLTLYRHYCGSNGPFVSLLLHKRVKVCYDLHCRVSLELLLRATGVPRVWKRITNELFFSSSSFLHRAAVSLRNLSEGIFPRHEVPGEVSTDEDDDMFCSRKRMKRRRREEEEEPPATKKSKSASRCLFSPQFHYSDSWGWDSVTTVTKRAPSGVLIEIIPGLRGRSFC